MPRGGEGQEIYENVDLGAQRRKEEVKRQNDTRKKYLIAISFVILAVIIIVIVHFSVQRSQPEKDLKKLIEDENLHMKDRYILGKDS